MAAGRVIGAVSRVAAPGEWRTNVALGAVRAPVVEPPPEACALAIAAAEAVDGNLVGVDLLPTPGGAVVLELNGACDFTAEYSPDDDVFASAILALAEDAVGVPALLPHAPPPERPLRGGGDTACLLGGRAYARAGAEARRAGRGTRRARGRADRAAHVHLDVPRHGRPPARAPRDHTAAACGAWRQPLAAEASARGWAARAEKRGGPTRVPAELGDLLVGVLHGTELEPVAVLRTRRIGKRASPPAGTVEAVVDEVARMEGRRATDEFTELELELVEGEPPALKEAEKVLVKAGAKASNQRPKVLRLPRGRARAPALRRRDCDRPRAGADRGSVRRDGASRPCRARRRRRR